MRLARTGIAVEYGVASLPDKLKRPEFVPQRLHALRQLVQVKLLHVLVLRESCSFEALCLCVPSSLLVLCLEQFTEEAPVVPPLGHGLRGNLFKAASDRS